MHTRIKKFALGVLVIAFAPILVFLAHQRAQHHSVEQVRARLHSEGFRTRPEQFTSVPSDAALKRAETLTNISLSSGPTWPTDIRTIVIEAASSFVMSSSNSARVIWKEEFAAGPKKRSPWPAVRQTVEKKRIALDVATTALLQGDIEFPHSHQEEHWSVLDNLPDHIRMFSFSMLADLHDGARAEAWTNLLVMTRLVTAVKPQPLSRFHRARFNAMSMLQTATWQALQAGNWSEAHLNALEREWRKINFFEMLPEVVEADGAATAQQCADYRESEFDSPPSLKQIAESPKDIRYYLLNFFQALPYRYAGSYRDEADALIYFRDRVQDVREAIRASSFDQMRSLVIITNTPKFISRNKPPMALSVFNHSFSVTMQNGGVGMLGLAAQAEMRRRIILTAFALERRRNRAGEYPEKLGELGKDHLLTDFADGEPLRYRRLPDGRFLLYSVGLDCVDNFGNAPNPKNRVPRPARTPPHVGFDIIWPLPDFATRLQSNQTSESFTN